MYFLAKNENNTVCLMCGDPIKAEEGFWITEDGTAIKLSVTNGDIGFFKWWDGNPIEVELSETDDPEEWVRGLCAQSRGRQKTACSLCRAFSQRKTALCGRRPSRYARAPRICRKDPLRPFLSRLRSLVFACGLS